MEYKELNHQDYLDYLISTHDEKNMKLLLIKWAIERNLHQQDPKLQMLKLTEEIGELAKALIKNDMPNIIDGMGDTLVVLHVLALQLGLDIDQCLDHAYNEIKDRKGKIIDGTFVKEE